MCWPAVPDLPPGPLQSVSLNWGYGPGDYGVGCALTESGEATCWHFYSADRPGPYAMTSLASGACGVTGSGEVVCRDHASNWSPDVPAGRYVSVSTGTAHGCALTNAGEAHCWGEFGQHDYGFPYGPVDPPPGRYTAITSGHHRACAVTEAGAVVCWGDTEYREWPGYDLPYRE